VHHTRASAVYIAADDARAATGYTKRVTFHEPTFLPFILRVRGTRREKDSRKKYLVAINLRFVFLVKGS